MATLFLKRRGNPPDEMMMALWASFGGDPFKYENHKIPARFDPRPDLVDIDDILATYCLMVDSYVDMGSYVRIRNGSDEITVMR